MPHAARQSGRGRDVCDSGDLLGRVKGSLREKLGTLCPARRDGALVENSIMYGRWWADRMYLMVPAQTVVAKYMESLKGFPPARGSSLSLGKVMEQIKFATPGQ